MAPEQPFRTPIPACDNAIEVLAYNCIVTGLNDRSQPTRSLFTFTKLSLDLLAIPHQRCLPAGERFDFRNVAIDLKHGVITEQLHPAVYKDFVAILADMA